MKKCVVICAAVLINAASLGAAARVATSRPATRPAPGPTQASLIAQADKHESAGQYALAAKYARAALAGAGKRGLKSISRIRKQLRRLALRLSSARRLEAMSAALAKRPEDIAIRERIIKLCVVELDNPTMALKFINEDVDQILQTYVPLAAGKLSKIGEASCRELAAWYASHLDKTSPVGKIAMLRRVAACCDRFLQLHKSVDDEHRHATQQRQSAVRSLAEMGETFTKDSN
jgi:hypothetical protein